MTRGRNPDEMGVSEWAIKRHNDRSKKKRPNSAIYHKLWSDNIIDDEVRAIFDDYEITGTAYSCVIENKNLSIDIKADINYLFSFNMLFDV